MGEPHPSCPAPQLVPPCHSQTGPQPKETWEAQSSGPWSECQHTLGTGCPSSLFKPHQMRPPGQEGFSSHWLLSVCWGLGFTYPVLLRHIYSGSFQVQKDIWDAVTTEKKVVIFQIIGQINDLSHLLLVLTATGPWEQGTRIPFGAFLGNMWLTGDIFSQALVGLLTKAWFIAYYLYKYVFFLDSVTFICSSKNRDLVAQWYITCAW